MINFSEARLPDSDDTLDDGHRLACRDDTSLFVSGVPTLIHKRHVKFTKYVNRMSGRLVTIDFAVGHSLFRMISVDCPDAEYLFTDFQNYMDQIMILASD